MSPFHWLLLPLSRDGDRDWDRAAALRSLWLRADLSGSGDLDWQPRRRLSCCRDDRERLRRLEGDLRLDLLLFRRDRRGDLRGDFRGDRRLCPLLCLLDRLEGLTAVSCFLSRLLFFRFPPNLSGDDREQVL